MAWDKVILMLLGMLAVTYIPRALPVILVDKIKYSEKTEKFLNIIPYTAMTALVFPGVLTVDANYMIGIAGITIASILAWFKCPAIICVIGAIIIDFILYLFI